MWFDGTVELVAFDEGRCLGVLRKARTNYLWFFAFKGYLHHGCLSDTVKHLYNKRGRFPGTHKNYLPLTFPPSIFTLAVWGEKEQETGVKRICHILSRFDLF